MDALEVKEFELDEGEASVDKIIQSVPAENSTPNLFSRWSQASNDLEFEFDQILNLQ